MSDEQHQDVTGWGILARVLFAFGATAVVVLGAYLAVAWLAGLHK